MSEAGRLPAGVLDTCVFIDLQKIPDEALPMSAGVATVTLAELAMGSIWPRTVSSVQCGSRA
ncbi:MAG TPA: hypothetical protein VGS97_25650 [Actinocrinis sp.]|uniref:hypothetical protein n=1 Tax=Actinocrinis sp. TaxID=1920516 RepID=UPI002DDD2C17|nr:hypothetical protein [Actinocrinis sp.]HEV2347502.1 hypothetical protein [Actinocrinis sp.]